MHGHHCFFHQKSENYLKDNNIVPVYGCINVCQDSQGRIYRIPNFCINLPYFEKQLMEDDGMHTEELTIKLYL